MVKLHGIIVTTGIKAKIHPTNSKLKGMKYIFFKRVWYASPKFTCHHRDTKQFVLQVDSIHHDGCSDAKTYP